MLVLSRHVNQGITVKDDNGKIIAHIFVVETRKNGSVKLGITAERSIIVDRDEVHLLKTSSQ